MSGPVWRFEPEASGLCDVCLRESTGMVVEGCVEDSALRPMRRVCSRCYASSTTLVVAGEVGGKSTSPAYVRHDSDR